MSTMDLSRALPWTLFFSGIYMASFAASGLFFLKFWKRTRERFFFLFALACWMLAIERVALLFFEPTSEPYSWCYLIRLVAFGLIVHAFLRANVPSVRNPS